MRRKTQRDDNGFIDAGIEINCVNGSYDIWDKEWLDDALERLATIEDIIGDEYNLDHIRELTQADRDGRCVVLDGKSRDKELICKLMRLLYWLEDSIKKKDFSPFRIVAGAPENNYPFISAFHRIEDEYDLEIHLAGKDEEAKAALKERKLE